MSRERAKYQAPCIDVYYVVVEQGFISSADYNFTIGGWQDGGNFDGIAGVED
ncbi:MAG: hypothetical protein IKA81_07790 [Alistipes sp.]|nr:hypothetical protein [Alistipes sp.]